MVVPFLTDIARASTVDGPGIRTVVFIKGCPLRCIWCHNPETQQTQQEIRFHPGSCIGCGDCRCQCPQKKPLSTDNCTCCGRCTITCPTLSRQILGQSYKPEELADVIMKDYTYFRVSGGGVTFSGGEPLLYPRFLADVCKFLKFHDVHVTIETSGYFDLVDFYSLLSEYVDLILFDLKLFDRTLHQKYTGRENALILNNFESLSRSNTALLPRIPVVPGITDTKQNLKALAGFLVRNNHFDAELLPYNPCGISNNKNTQMDERLQVPMHFSEFDTIAQSFRQLIQQSHHNLSLSSTSKI